MGVEARRPPLPAPTESMDETSGVDTEVATNLTSTTNKTSYEIPEDGSPITISTQKATRGGLLSHGRQKSQTSLLIEYFETSRSGDKSRSRPSVRVKVTPSSAKKGRIGSSDHVQITGIGADRKPSYTRRIALGNKSLDSSLAPTAGTEISHSSGSNVSGRPPVEIEVLEGSDLSAHRSSRGLQYAPIESNVSSMPPDSMLDGDRSVLDEHSFDRGDDDVTVKDADYLSAPSASRNRTASRERLAQRVAEKINASAKTHRSGRERSSKESAYEDQPRERRRRSSKSHREEENVSAESSLVSSNLAGSQRSYRSGSSQGSRVTNNSRLLEIMEDTIKRMILPEINAIKEERKTDRNLRSFEDSRRASLSKGDQESASLERRVSKSSSSPNIASKPKVVLNREDDDPGIVLSRGDSERIKDRKSSREHSGHRPASRRSSGGHSRRESYEEDEASRHKSSRSSHRIREEEEEAAAAVAGGVLTAAALRHHDSSHGDVHERRKKRSKSRSSRSRSASLAELEKGDEYARREDIPPMPLASHINESDVTRESILSRSTERPHSRGGTEMRTPIREVSRGSLASPLSSPTPTRTPVGKTLGMTHVRDSTESPSGSPHGNKTRVAELAAAGPGAAALAKGLEADGYGEVSPRSQRNPSSPVHSVSSLRKNFEDDDPLVPAGLRPRSAASRSSAGREHARALSRSAEGSPTTTAKLARSRAQSRNVSLDEFNTPLERPDPDYLREGAGTPSRELTDEWLEREHERNERYRNSMGDSATNRDSYQTNPYPQDEKHFTMFTDDGTVDKPDHSDDGEGDEERDIQGLGANPNFVHSPVAVESAVASLMEPSFVSSNMISNSSTRSATKENRSSYSERMAEHLRSQGKDSPAMYEGSTLSQTIPSEDRWAGLRNHARKLSSSQTFELSPRQSPVKSMASRDSEPVMGASALPVAGEDDAPMIGHYHDSGSDLTTNPSIIQGPLGGDASGKDTWPYTPEPERRQHDEQDQRFGQSAHGKEELALGAAAAGTVAALVKAHKERQPTVEDEEPVRDTFTPDARRQGAQAVDGDVTPTGSPAPFGGDEGYVTDARARSGGALTPRASQQRFRDEYQRAMDAHDDDLFAPNVEHSRRVSGDSHGIASPLYDRSTGRGVEHIQSRDIVALMDHLTVRDAQRFSHDTEVVTSLVRSAAEMRQYFDDLKRFITEQDKKIMQNADRNAEQTVQRVLGGPRPQPQVLGSPRAPRSRVSASEEDMQTKRRGVLRRALKGLTGGKSSSDLARIEDMLTQILNDVEDLKHQQGGAAKTAPAPSAYGTNSVDSFERVRAAADSGYEPEGQADTSSTPSQSGHFGPPARGKELFHSGYDGRRGSENRVSTVLEDDEDEELQPHEKAVLSNQFENNERMLTSTRDAPAAQYSSPERHRKHKSNSSSLFGISVPKVSRWSKTTASSAAPDLDSPRHPRNFKPSSQASRSISDVDEYEDDRANFVQEDDRTVSSAKSGARSVRSQGSRLTRTPSPLIPSEASSRRRDPYDDDDDGKYDDRARSPEQHDDDDDDLTPEFDDPKYQAHRNSLLLQHPQPRPGNTPRHQKALESQAHAFDDGTGTNSDVSRKSSDFDPAVWGSAGTAGLARHRLSVADPAASSSPATAAYRVQQQQQQQESLVPDSAGRKAHHHKAAAAAPPPAVRDDEPDEDESEDDDEVEWEEPQFSASGFSKGGGGGANAYTYSSPYGSGHLLEPIEEVRYSLETDRSGHISPEPQLAQAVDLRSPARKVTGPRPMGSKSPKPQLVETTGAGSAASRRKPVGGGTSASSDSKSRFWR